MNRLDATFERLRNEGRKGLVGYLTAGDPDLAASEMHIRTAIEKGLDILELGVPFSDPTADGPTIQAAAFRALAGGTTLPGVLDMVRRLRADYDAILVGVNTVAGGGIVGDGDRDGRSLACTG